MNQKYINRFWTKVNKTSNPNGCWEWIAGKTKAGYGVFSIEDRKIKYAHRISYNMHKGDIADNMHVCHSCDNPSCVNPDHLWLGTPADNAKDRDIKGRNSSPPILNGIDHANSKLTTEDIIDIRKKRLTQMQYAKKYNIHQTNVSNIQNRHTWKHI